MRDVCAAAVDAAVGAGASYADARVVVRRDQRVSTRNRKVDDVTDTETAGIGVRVLVGGAWGFAATRDLGAARDTALAAVAFAAASPGRHDRTLAALEPATGTWRGPVEIDPFTVPVDEKVEHLLRAEEAMRHTSVTVTEAFAFA